MNNRQRHQKKSLHGRKVIAMHAIAEAQETKKRMSAEERRVLLEKVRNSSFTRMGPRLSHLIIEARHSDKDEEERDRA